MPPKIIGAQRDFSFGEVDVALKRADDHPARKGGLRQMANARILNSGSLQDRPGRTALYPNTFNCSRIEEVVLSPGNVFKIAFAPSRIEIRSAAGAILAAYTAQVTTAPFPWTTAADIQKIVFTVARLSICITFAGMRPQLISWDGVSTWSLAAYNELVSGNQKRTPFYRIAPQGITIQPSALTGAISITASAAVFTPQHVGARIRYIYRQIIITSYISPTQATGVVQETLNGSQTLQFAVTPANNFSVGDVVVGSLTGSKGIVTFVNGPGLGIIVQLLTSTTVSAVTIAGSFAPGSSAAATTQSFAFLTGESAVGPANAMVITNVGPVFTPQPCAIWDEEVMNDLRGYPASCFFDQFRLGFCDFPSVPNGIAWSAINSPNDMYVGANPSDAMFEVAPAKVRIYHVVPGPESSEFVFTDRRIYYIPISPTNPLKPGSVQFAILSGDGSAQVHPRLAQEAILYCNAGQNSVMAIIATGAYLRPFNTKNLSEFHSHLFNGIQCIAAPSADGTFNERYAYVLNGDGSIAVGKYDADTLPSATVPTIGWGPWSGAGTVSWIAAQAANVLFTTSYFGTGICEILDDSQYLDCTLPVNSAPAAFAPPGGKGPLWFIAGQTVTLMDQGTRFMGTYQIDANGFIVPQNNGGENLNAASLDAGQPWTMTTEPFVPDANPGTDVGQRMFRRRVSRMAVCVIHSTGFTLARLFSGALTRTSPALGTVMNFRRFPAWNQDDDPTLPPPQRETVERIRPIGRTFDPRVAIIKDTPGPLLIAEIGLEATV